MLNEVSGIVATYHPQHQYHCHCHYHQLFLILLLQAVLLMVSVFPLLLSFRLPVPRTLLRAPSIYVAHSTLHHLIPPFLFASPFPFFCFCLCLSFTPAHPPNPWLKRSNQISLKPTLTSKRRRMEKKRKSYNLNSNKKLINSIRYNIKTSRIAFLLHHVMFLPWPWP